LAIMTDTQKKCFVLMPFSEEFKEIFTEVYKPVCQDNLIHCWRVDEIARPGSITKDIIEGILDADIIIADLTTKNPNVFYELGIAHSVGNKTIMTAQNLADVPFDIANYRIIVYQHSLTGCRELHQKLDTAIKELLTALDRTNNPFQEVASNRATYRFKDKIPLIKFINFSSLKAPIRDYFYKNNIIYKNDLKNSHLEELRNHPEIGTIALNRLIAQLVANDLYDDMEYLHRFIIENRMKVVEEKNRY
jgi:hypothetical protein